MTVSQLMEKCDIIDTQTAIEGLVDWWALAGVDTICAEDAHSFLQPAAAVAGQPALPAETLDRTPVPMPHTKQAPVANTAVYPSTIVELHAQLATKGALPGSEYSPKSLSPRGNPNAPLVIVTDVPDIADTEAGQLFGGPAGQLLESMMKAIGLDLSQCYMVSLANSRPASGSIPTEDLDALAALMRHHFSLIEAPHFLLLGNSVSHALMGGDLFAARGSLRYINHSGGKKAGVTSFHPRSLIANPNFKAQCWHDLQLLKKDMNL